MREKRQGAERKTGNRLLGTWQGTDRGLSDLVGFTLAFAVILTSVALVSTVGVDALESIRDTQQENNAERAFSVMAEHFDEIEQDIAPSRTSEIDLHDGRMVVQNITEFTITVEHTGHEDFVKTFAPKRILLQPNPSTRNVMVYENGATIRGRNGTQQGIVQNSPQMICNDEQVIVSMVVLETAGNRQLGSGTVRVTAREKETRLIYPVNRTGENSSEDVYGKFKLVIEGGFEKAWRKTLLQSDQNWKKLSSGNGVYCPTPERVFVRETVIRVTFTR